MAYLSADQMAFLRVRSKAVLMALMSADQMAVLMADQTAVLMALMLAAQMAVLMADQTAVLMALMLADRLVERLGVPFLCIVERLHGILRDSLYMGIRVCEQRPKD
jgi:hypothetical protein